MAEIKPTEEDLKAGNRLADMNFPKGTLVMMIKRGQSVIVPNGQIELLPDDILLTIAHEGEEKGEGDSLVEQGKNVKS